MGNVAEILDPAEGGREYRTLDSYYPQSHTSLANLLMNFDNFMNYIKVNTSLSGYDKQRLGAVYKGVREVHDRFTRNSGEPSFLHCLRPIVRMIDDGLRSDVGLFIVQLGHDYVDDGVKKLHEDPQDLSQRLSNMPFQDYELDLVMAFTPFENESKVDNLLRIVETNKVRGLIGKSHDNVDTAGDRHFKNYWGKIEQFDAQLSLIGSITEDDMMTTFGINSLEPVRKLEGRIKGARSNVLSWVNQLTD